MSKELIWFAPLYDPSGYANCARDYIFALHKLGAKVKAEPVTFWSPIKGGLTEEQQELLKALEQTPVSSDASKVQHMVPDCYHKDRNFETRKMNIGYTVFETDRIPATWVKRMEMMGKIFVPTTFNLATFHRGGVPRGKMVKIPHIVNTEKLDPSKYEPMPVPDHLRKEFYFLSILDFTKRKGWDILLRSYLREFRGNRDVGLIFKAYFGGVTDSHKQNLIKRLKAFKHNLGIKNPPDIIFFGEVMPDIQLYRLYKTAHCYVHCSRGEGWNLTASESMAMEMPVITTNWSGHLEFCKPEHSYLIDVLGFELADEEMIKISPNYTGQKWAIPSEEHLRKLMRHVYENYSEAKEKGRKGRKFLQENFSPEIIGRKILENIP
jgi:glycosyltransferase involved in cell wall biosynthesis